MFRAGMTDERAAMFEGDDLVADGESDSGAFADRLGGVKGIKHARLDLCRDAAAVVLNPDLEGVLGDRCVGGDGDGGMGIKGHMRVKCVDAVVQEVHEHLVELAGKTGYGRKRAVIFVDANGAGVSLQTVVEDEQGAFNAFVDIDGFAIGFIKAREVPQAEDDFTNAIGADLHGTQDFG